MSDKATVVVGGNIVPLGSDYAGTPTYRPTKVDANGIQHVALATDNTGLAKDGNDITGVTMPTGGTGIRGWLSAIFNTIGTGATGVTQRTGGSGLFGWLSSIYYTLTSQTTSMTDGTQKVQVTSTPSPQAATAAPATNQIAVGTTPVALQTGGSALASRKYLFIRNLDNVSTLYIGPSNVSIGTGWSLYPGEYLYMELNPSSTATWYGVASSTIQVNVMEVA